jgi:NADPH:quinone reductase-like Zn-dependent oxidoreductase
VDDEQSFAIQETLRRNDMSVSTMKAAAIDRFGSADELTLHTLSMPAIGPDDVLVRVDTAGVGEWDPWVREGEFAAMVGQKPHFPYVLGSDGAGTIAAVGERVSRFREGDQVYGYSALSEKDGFYAEYTAMKADDVAPLPKGLTLEAAGAMPADAVTALCGLELLKLRAGSSMFVFGASGGIGHLAVQLAKRMGVRVLAVASREDGVALVRRLGADAAVDGHGGDITEAAQAFAPDGMDAALVTASGEGLDDALDALRNGARVAYPRGVEPEPEVRAGVQLHAYDGRATPALFERLNHWIEAAPFTVVTRTYPLDRAAEAHRNVTQHHLGKLALKIAPA